MRSQRTRPASPQTKENSFNTGSIQDARPQMSFAQRVGLGGLGAAVCIASACTSPVGVVGVTGAAAASSAGGRVAYLAAFAGEDQLALGNVAYCASKDAALTVMLLGAGGLASWVGGLSGVKDAALAAEGTAVRLVSDAAVSLRDSVPATVFDAASNASRAAASTMSRAPVRVQAAVKAATNAAGGAFTPANAVRCTTKRAATRAASEVASELIAAACDEDPGCSSLRVRVLVGTANSAWSGVKGTPMDALGRGGSAGWAAFFAPVAAANAAVGPV